MDASSTVLEKIESQLQGSASVSDFWNLVAVDYPLEYDYLVSFVRLFKDPRVTHGIIDSKYAKFQIESANFAEGLKLITMTFEDYPEDQYSRYVLKMTDLGRKVFLDSKAPTEYLK